MHEYKLKKKFLKFKLNKKLIYYINKLKFMKINKILKVKWEVQKIVFINKIKTKLNLIFQNYILLKILYKCQNKFYIKLNLNLKSFKKSFDKLLKVLILMKNESLLIFFKIKYKNLINNFLIRYWCFY